MKNFIFSLLLGILFFSAITVQASSHPIVHTIPGAQMLTDVEGFNNSLVCVTSYSGMYFSTNTGSSWTNVYEGVQLHDIAKERATGFAVGCELLPQGPKPVILRTRNAGRSWERLTIPDTFFVYPCKVACKGNFVIAGAGGNNRVWYSTDQGATWTSIQTSAWFQNYGHLSIQDGEIYSTCDLVYKSSDGINWQYVPVSPMQNGILSVAKPNTELIAVGYRSGDYYPMLSRGMPNLQPIVFTEAGPGQFADIKFMNSQKGFICGRGMRSGGIPTSIIYQTNDGGENWASVYDSISLPMENVGLMGISTAQNTDYFCGQYSVIVIPDNLTNTGEGQGHVEKYNLQQNFPNPFNPETKINFSLPKSSFVDLKVYNSIGKEVATLMHETKPAGEQSVTFNGANLSSGVYFYKLSTESFTETKKMILNK